MTLAPGVDLAIGLGLTLGFGVLALALRMVSTSGFVAGLAVGVPVSLAWGWRGFVVLATFFALGSLTTKLRWRQKCAAGLAQERGGTRDGRHALANGGAAAALGLVQIVHPSPEPLVALAFAGAVAAALADTLGSEIGKAFGRRAFRVFPPRREEPGVPGAVSVEGTLAGFAGASLLGGVGLLLGLLEGSGMLAVALAGLLASLAESLAASMGRPRSGHARNALNTVVGAGLAAGLGAVLA
jgi:uncharacterized protein (TIGR00297 family)